MVEENFQIWHAQMPQNYSNYSTYTILPFLSLTLLLLGFLMDVRLLGGGKITPPV